MTQIAQICAVLDICDYQLNLRYQRAIIEHRWSRSSLFFSSANICSISVICVL